MSTDYLVIIAQPKANYEGGACVGSVLAHKLFSDKYGYVFWDFQNHLSNNKIKNILFYDASVKKITHRADIEGIFFDKISEDDDQYVPEFRKMYSNRKGWSYIKIKNIRELINPLSPDELKLKVGRGNIRYVKYGDIPSKDRKITFEMLADEIIFKSLFSGSFSENDIRDILYLYGICNSMKIHKEHFLSKENRADIILEKNGIHYIIEIKIDFSDLETLKQIERYIKCFAEKNNIPEKNIRGIILSRNPSPELEKSLENNKKISIINYRFLVDFGNLMKD